MVLQTRILGGSDELISPSTNFTTNTLNGGSGIKKLTATKCSTHLVVVEMPWPFIAKLAHTFGI